MINLRRLRHSLSIRAVNFLRSDSGIGIPFADGFDTYWYLPSEPWYFLMRQSSCSDDPLTLFQRLEERRSRFIDVLRRYLAKQKIAVDRYIEWSMVRHERIGRHQRAMGWGRSDATLDVVG